MEKGWIDWLLGKICGFLFAFCWPESLAESTAVTVYCVTEWVSSIHDAVEFCGAKISQLLDRHTVVLQFQNMKLLFSVIPPCTKQGGTEMFIVHKMNDF